MSEAISKKAMHDDVDTNVKKYQFFPEGRLFPSYPFIVWLIGWCAVAKSVIWLFTDPNGPEKALTYIGFKYFIFMIPLFITGTGIWNKKKWAIWGLIIVCVCEIMFFIIYPLSLHTLVLNDLSNVTLLFSILIFIVNGPISDIVILLMLPFAFKYCK